MNVTLRTSHRQESRLMDANAAHRDARTLAAREVQIGGQFAGKVYRIYCFPLQMLATTDFESVAIELADLIADTDRESGLDCTIILDVVESTVVPTYVDLAVEELLLRRMRLGLIVTCCKETTHDVDSTFPHALRENLAQVNRRGVIWNPVAERVVPAQPVVETSRSRLC